MGLVRITVCEGKRSGVIAVWGYVLRDRGRFLVKKTWNMEVTQFVGRLGGLSDPRVTLFGREIGLTKSGWLGQRLTSAPPGFSVRIGFGDQRGNGWGSLGEELRVKWGEQSWVLFRVCCPTL